MKKDTFYFPHDYNARNDRKLIRLRAKYGMAGIGTYWSIVEMLYEEGGKIALTELTFIADELKAKVNIIEAVVNDFDLFSKDDKDFWSESVKRRLDKRLEKSEKAKASASQRWRNADGMRTHSEGNANKGKESKRKESKGSKGFAPPSVDDVIAYFKLKGYREEVAIQAHEYYDVAEWHDRDGKPVSNWKQKMISNWFKPENKEGATVRPLYAKLGATGTTGGESFFTMKHNTNNLL